MRLTNKSEYALLALIYIARKERQGFVHGEEIASAQEIPMRFLQQILHSLKQAGLIRAHKGKSGGYALARPAKEISLAEVIRLFEGPLASSRSASKNFYESTPIEGEKKMVMVLKELRDIVAKKLENTSLKDVV